MVENVVFYRNLPFLQHLSTDDPTIQRLSSFGVKKSRQYISFTPWRNYSANAFISDYNGFLSSLTEGEFHVQTIQRGRNALGPLRARYLVIYFPEKNNKTIAIYHRVGLTKPPVWKYIQTMTFPLTEEDKIEIWKKNHPEEQQQK